MKTSAVLPPKTLLRLSRLLRVVAVIAAAWAFHDVFEHRVPSAISAGLGLWVVLEIGAYRLRKRAYDLSPHLDRN